MQELDFFIKKIQDLEPRGEWKDVFGIHFEKIYKLVYQSGYLKSNFYTDTLKKLANSILDLPFSMDEDERLEFRKLQKQITDLLYQIKEENKRIILIHGRNTVLSDKIALVLGQLRLDYLCIDFESDDEKKIAQFIDQTKNCAYAIVALSPDDACRSLTTEGVISYRTSQIVWFQTGYFLAKIGKKNILFVLDENEKPND
jgi:hypothetical protein